MIDFHCHLDLYANPSAVISEVNARGTYVLAVTTTPHAWIGTKQLVGESPRIRVALGLHPELVATRANDLPLFLKFLPRAKYVGEVGIDGSKHLRGSFQRQEILFERILETCAEEGGRTLSIHSRNAASAVTSMLMKHPNAGTPVLHWFSGSPRQLEDACKLGCWFSINPMMLRAAKGRALVELMPIKRVLLETDGPFTLAGTTPLMPWETMDMIPQLADIWRMKAGSAKSLLKNNLSVLVKQQTVPIAPDPPNEREPIVRGHRV